ncbi:MAG: DNA polymerase I [Lachnospiraceae bacterium]|nr:DNA polymerase I [Lachnospiraceae bacterium]
MGEKLVLIDGHSILHRAFFGLPDLTNSQGIHTNAVYGFLNILFKILEEEKPQYLAVAFDVHAPTFRHEMFEEYKGTRKPMADELREQVPLMKEMLHAMGVMIVELAGFEADDLLGTIAVLGEQKGMEVSIVSGDRDLLQLATDHIQIRIPKTKKTGTEIENYYAKDVKERYLVTPKEFIDVKALMGDTSDNIPGVPGIGEKTATALIEKYKNIETIHEHAKEVKPPRAGKNIVEYWEQAVLSKTLATINVNVPIDIEPVCFTLEKAKIDGITSLYTQNAYLLCKQLEFKQFLQRFSSAEVTKQNINIEEYFKKVTSKKEVAKLFSKMKQKEQELEIAFSIVPNDKNKDKNQEADGQMNLFAIGVENAFEGISLCFDEKEIYYIPTSEEVTSAFLLEQIQQINPKYWIAFDVKSQLNYIDITEGLFTLRKKDAWNCVNSTECLNNTENKDWQVYLNRRNQYFDPMIASYLLNPLKGTYPYDDIAKDYLGLLLPTEKELAEDIFKKSCYTTYVAWKSKAVLLEELQKNGMDKLFYEMEMPLVFVLSDMEKEGICMDADALKEYSSKLESSIIELEKKIHAQAGEVFNINSPKQLGVVLFEKLGLPNGKKTKTGYSTSAEVLEKLSAEYPIVSDILEYRQLTKLKSTYADGLRNFVKDGKIHTNFNQTITATGRLSSTDPSLQNIPIRIELGRLIRKVFHPMESNIFVDSDYSQIELRILAHFSEDEKLIEAYKSGQDIHTITASQVFHVPFEEVTPLLRRNAKAVNFGIVYGISAFGLSQDLNIGRKEAQEYIDRYFETYPKIKEFIDRIVAEAKMNGKTKTMFGRIRPIPELSSSNFMQRQFGERVAMNAPIQGTAADIIKIAMINVHDRLLKEGFISRLILQVHDELLIETKENEKEQVIALLEEEMHKAAELLVPLEVGTASGYNWYDAH